MAAIAAQCPKPDPLETLAGKARDQLPLADYLMLRGALEQTTAALDADGSSDAAKAKETLQKLAAKAVQEDAQAQQKPSGAGAKPEPR